MDPASPYATSKFLIDQQLLDQMGPTTPIKKVKKPSPISVGSFGLQSMVTSFFGESKPLSPDDLRAVIQLIDGPKGALIGVQGVFANEQLRKTFKACCKKHECNEIYNFVKDYLSYLNKPSEQKCKGIVKDFIFPAELDSDSSTRIPLNIKDGPKIYEELTGFLNNYNANQEAISKLLEGVFKEVSEFFIQILY